MDIDIKSVQRRRIQLLSPMFTKCFAIGLLTSAAVCAAVGIEPDEKCFKCLCHKETGSEECDGNENCNGDIYSTSSCGSLNLDNQYFYKCSENGFDTPRTLWGKTFIECAVDRDCAIECVKRYMLLYAQECNLTAHSTCEQFIKLHYLGPRMCRKNLNIPDRLLTDSEMNVREVASCYDQMAEVEGIEHY